MATPSHPPRPLTRIKSRRQATLSFDGDAVVCHANSANGLCVIKNVDAKRRVATPLKGGGTARLDGKSGILIPAMHDDKGNVKYKQFRVHIHKP